MKYVAIIVLILLMIFGVYFFLNKKSDSGDDQPSGETNAERIAREAKAQLDARKESALNRPELYVIERYLTIQSDSTWFNSVKKYAEDYPEKGNYKKRLLNVAIMAAVTDNIISASEIQGTKTFGQLDTDGTEFQIRKNGTWETFKVADLIQEYQAANSSNLS